MKNSMNLVATNLSDFVKLLYSRDANGKLRVWCIEAYKGAYRTHEGECGGKIKESKWTECFGKNIGKSNETSAREQAVLEAKAKWQKRWDAGARSTPEELESNPAAFYEPMTAHKYEDHAHKLPDWVVVQPKLDGIRCIASFENGQVVLRSRKGKPIVAVPHIATALHPHFHKWSSGIVLDGELYNHELHDNFDKIVSLVRKTKPTLEDIAEALESVQYHVYDCFWADGRELCFRERNNILQRMLNPNSGIVSCVRRVLTEHILASEVQDLHDSHVANGYEGCMVRTLEGSYEHKRSAQLLKLKSFEDAEFPIVRIEEGVGNREGLATRAVCRLKDGREFAAGVMGNDAYAIKLFQQRKKLVGKQATIKFQNYTPAGVPRMGKMKVLRDYE